LTPTKLDRVWPQPDRIEDLIEISRRNLRSLWLTFSDLGIRHLVLCGVIASISESKLWIADAIGESMTTYVRLTADRSTRENSAARSRSRKWLRERHGCLRQSNGVHREPRSRGHSSGRHRSERPLSRFLRRCSRRPTGPARPDSLESHGRPRTPMAAVINRGYTAHAGRGPSEPGQGTSEETRYRARRWSVPPGWVE